ncbi:hypothetical protein, partial [Saccharopolyspora sp. NPDC002578]
GGLPSVASSLRYLFPEWLRHEGKSCPREEATENPRVVFLLWWSLLSGFAADRTKTHNAAHLEGQDQGKGDEARRAGRSGGGSG